MKKQISFTILSAITLLLIGGCSSSNLPTSGQAAPAQPAATTQPAATQAANQPSDTSPATEVQAQATPAPAALAPTEPPTSEAVTPPTAAPQQANKQPAAGSSDAADGIVKAMSASAAVKSFRIKVTTPQDAPGSTEIIETLNPGRTHEIQSEGGSVTREVISIDNKIYTKNGTDAWQVVPVTAKTQAYMDSLKANFTTVDAFRKFVSDAHIVGPENLDGTPTMVYQYTSTQSQTASGVTNSTTSVIKLWVAVSDGLPRKQDADYTVLAGGHSAEQKVTSTFYDYNADIKIEAPIP